MHPHAGDAVMGSARAQGSTDSEAVERHRKASRAIESDRKRSKGIASDRKTSTVAIERHRVDIERHRETSAQRSKDIERHRRSDRKTSRDIGAAIESDRKTSGLKKAPQLRRQLAPVRQQAPAMSFDVFRSLPEKLSMSFDRCADDYRCLSRATVMSPVLCRDGCFGARVPWRPRCDEQSHGKRLLQAPDQRNFCRLFQTSVDIVLDICRHLPRRRQALADICRHRVRHLQTSVGIVVAHCRRRAHWRGSQAEFFAGNLPIATAMSAK